jgi:uncharacterized protein with GYD domain
MPHYLFRAKYSVAGIQGVVKDGAASRNASVRALAESVGGTVIAQFWAFGDDDYILIGELPDNAAAMAVAATVGASGSVSISTTVLLDEAEVDEALGRRPIYRAPGA